MTDPQSIYGPPLTDGTPASEALPPISSSPPSRPPARSASESEWDVGQKHLAGVRKVSEPTPLRSSPLGKAITLNGDSGSPTLDITTPTPPLTFDSNNPFAASYQKPELAEMYDCPSPLSRTVYRNNLVDYDSQDENSPHIMSSSSDTDEVRQSLDTMPASRTLTSAAPVKARPKSILSRLLRHTNDEDFEPVPGPNPRSAQPISAPGPVTKATKRKSTNPDKWTKRASRKAPPPPISLSSPTDEPLAALGLQLSRQSGNGIDSPRRNIGNFWRKSEDDRATLDEDDEMSWERVRTLPRVCLFPPEEESSEPITLYPPPAPPQLRRPPTLLLARERERVSNSSSRASLYSSTSIGTGTDVWGGMAGGFQKPPPVFKRQPRRGSMVPQGVVMPKSRDQVEKEQEWRMSMINQEMDEFDLAWRAEHSPPVGPLSPPRLARQQSLPQVIPRQSLEEAAPIIPRPQAPLVNPFAKDDIPAPIAQSSPPSAGIYDRPASIVSPERSASAPPAIDFGASPPPLVLVTPDSESSLAPQAGDAEASDVTPRPTPVVNERPLSSLERVRQATAAPPVRRSSEETVDFSSTGSTSRPNKGLRNRRSMSLTSMLSSKQKDEAPPVPSAQPAPKTIKKQRSLKKFFFSSDNLARDDSAPMPPLPKRDKEQEQVTARERELQRDRVKVIANEMKEREKQFEKDKQREKEEKQRLKDAEKAEGSRRSTRPLMSRPKSKPNLRIDIKATKSTTLPSPSIPAMPHSAPMSTTSSASSAYPETPASGSQPSIGGRSTSTSTKGSPPAPPSASRGITKRFSLTNMSGAFRRSRKNLAAAEAPPVPQVPDLPDVYKKEKAFKPKPWQSKHSAPPTSTAHAEALQAAYAVPHVIRTSSVPMPSSSKMAKSSSLPHVEFDGAPGSFLSNEDQNAYLSPQSKARELDAESSVALGPAHQAIHHNQSSLSNLENLNHAQMSPTGSVFSDSSSTFELEQELDEAQLVLVSPKSRRDPAVSLQTVMGITPGARMSRFVESPAVKRKSVEAIVVGPLLVPPTPPQAVYLSSLAESPSSIEESAVRATLEFDGPEFDELDNTPTRSPPPEAQPERTDSTDMMVVGSPRLGPSQSESETSLESLSRSSVSSEPSELPCVTPASPNSETLHYASLSMTAMVPDVPVIDLGSSPYRITDLPEVTDSPASQMEIDDEDEELMNQLDDKVAIPTVVESSPSEESDLVVVHHSPSFALVTSPLGSPAAASGSTISPRHGSKWSPDGGLFRFLSGGSDKGSPRSITSIGHKRRSGTSPSTSPRQESEGSTPLPTHDEISNSLGLDLDSTAQISFPVPPSKPDGFTGLGDKVQLKSIHFDSLSLDFEGFDWSKSALGGQGLGLEGMDEETLM